MLVSKVLVSLKKVRHGRCWLPSLSPLGMGIDQSGSKTLKFKSAAAAGTTRDYAAEL